MRMVRKQVYITAEQDAMLKRLAEQQGMTEAEIVRAALEGLSAISYEAGEGRSDHHLREVAVKERYMTEDRDQQGARAVRADHRRLEDEAWQEELAFMRSIGAGKQAARAGGAAWRFNRDEIYEERLAKILRRH